MRNKCVLLYETEILCLFFTLKKLKQDHTLRWKITAGEIYIWWFAGRGRGGGVEYDGIKWKWLKIKPTEYEVPMGPQIVKCEHIGS